MQPGDLILRALQRGDLSINFDLDSVPKAWDGLDQGGTDPGNIVEFLAYDIPFEVEPATGVIFPKEVDRD
ncbi:MAG: hypothetical protein ACRDKB_00775 [Actinomycetota bacterium]